MDREILGRKSTDVKTRDAIDVLVKNYAGEQIMPENGLIWEKITETEETELKCIYCQLFLNKYAGKK